MAEEDPVEGQVESSEFQRQLWESMQKLSPRQRAAIVQRYYLDMSEKEIASELKAAPGTVKWLLHSARKNLRALLSERTEK
jgi:RNA polymerase sigma-70 factor (ECF subfamily)